MALQIQESWVDATRGCRLGDSDWYEPFTDDRGRLYRSLVKEYGRCTGKVYVDHKRPVATDPTLPAYRLEAEPVGWVFLKRRPYDRGEGSYLAETWIAVRETA